ncbi:MAG: TMEM165/GDT1 family protein [Candidatus Hodarchaeales archaeon]
MVLIEGIEAFSLALFSVLLMELGDKTQLTAFALSIKYRSPVKVFLGVLAGLTGVTLIAVVSGLLLKENLEFTLLKPIIGMVFIFGGILFLILEYRDRNIDETRICPVSLDLCDKPHENCPEMDRCEIFLDTTVRKGAFIKSFSLMFFAELGDKTMLMSLGLSIQFNPIGVFLGAVSALAIVNFIGVFAGDKIAKIVPKDILSVVSGLLFIITGLFILLF